MSVQELAPADTVELSRRRMNIVFVTVLVATLLSALDQTIVSTALPTIVGDLGGSDHLSWVVSAYLLADTVSTVLAGKLGDLFGRTRVLQISAGLFVLASATCGFANSMTWLIASRTVQGLGAGGLAVTASAVIADVIPIRERAKYQGGLGAAFGVSLVLGPLLGGFFTDSLSWRWVFLINIPLGLAVMAIAARTLPKITARTRPNVDYLGIAFVTAGAAALTLALSFGGSEYPWGSGMVIGLFIASAVAFIGFVWAESRAAEPMLPLRLFRSPVFSVGVVLAFIVGFAMLGALTFLPTYSQYVKGVSPTASGVRTLPMVVSMLGTSLLAGAIVGRTGKYKIFPIVGCAVMGLGLWMLSGLTPESGYRTLALDMFVLGAGIGLSMQVLTIIVQSSADFRDLGVATSGVNFFRTLGSSFGTAIFGTIFATALAPVLRSALIHSPGVNPAALATPKSLHAYPAHQIAPIVSAYSHALHVVFLWAVPIAGLGVLLALFLKQVPIRTTELAGASDLGSGFGMPVGEDRAAILERAIVQVIRKAGSAELGERLRASGTSLDAVTGWGVGVIAARARLGLPASLTAVAQRRGVPVPVLRPAFDAARSAGYLEGPDDALVVTDRGQQELSLATTAARGWLAEQLEGWDIGGDPELAALTERLSVQLTT